MLSIRNSISSKTSLPPGDMEDERIGGYEFPPISLKQKYFVRLSLQNIDFKLFFPEIQ